MQLLTKFWKILEKRYQNILIILVFLMIVGAVFETLGVTLIIPLIGIVLSEELSIPDFILTLLPFLE